jgi:hypothetical protein
MSSSSVEIRELFQSGDRIIAEVTIDATISGRSRAMEGCGDPLVSGDPVLH